MAITIELYEDTGPVSAGRGSTTTLVDNIGWKDSPFDETNAYVFYPLQRPIHPSVYTMSYTKYNFFKITTDTLAPYSRLYINITGNYVGSPPSGYRGCNGKVKLFYKMTNIYQPPSNSLTGLTYIPPGSGSLILLPFLSTTGPDTATSTLPINLSSNTTYYTNYLVTQLFVEQGNWNDYGNIGSLNIQLVFREINPNIVEI